MKAVVVLGLLLATQTSCTGVSESCLDYTDAITACVEIAAENALESVDMETGDPKDFCKEMGDSQTDDEWDCMAKAYRAAECSTDAGWVAATEAIIDCDPSLE
jgi:hypothetical protein